MDPLYPVPPQDPIREDAIPGDRINALRQEAFDYVPPTVNKKRGAAVYDTNDQAFGFAVDPTSADEELSHVRRVCFADRQTLSTPHKPHMDIPDVSGIYPHEDEVGPSIGMKIMSSLLVMDLFQAQTLMPVWLHLLRNSKRSKSQRFPS